MRTSKTVLGRVLFLVMMYPLSYPAMAQLKADFTASPQTGCAPLVVKFTDASQGSPSSYKWDLGNGVVSSDQNPATSYFDPGVYTVRLTISDASGSDSIVKTSFITVYKNPVAAFSVSDSTGCFPLNVLYTDNSIAGSGSIASHTWDFGDGNISADPQPSHTYMAGGTFSVTLTVTNTYGCTATAARKNLIHISHGIKADFSINAGQICHSPAVINFTETASGDGALSYKWNFGDGASSTQATPSHNYNNAGVYTISLKVNSNLGCSDTISKTLNVAFVKSAINAADNVCLNQQTQFINASSPVPASSAWDFGDSTTSSSISPYKSYTAPGQYTVKQVNMFFAGCVDSTTRNITVVSGVTPSFSTADTASCSYPYTVHFKNTTAASGLSYVWDFGDGNTSTEINPVHEYDKYGSYTVTLKAANAGGCQNKVGQPNAVVVQPVKITGVSGLLAGCAPVSIKPVVKTNVSVVISKYFWDFGDGTSSTDASPVHTYTKEGIYAVKVKIITDGGCADSIALLDSVGHKLHPTFTVEPTNVCASKEVTFNNTTAEQSDFLWWYLGDGTVIYKQPNPSHNFADTGYFDATLVVANNGCLDTLTKKKAVHITAPIARFKVQNDCGNRMRISITDKSIGDLTHMWDFGDGTTDTAKNPVHIYGTTGAYKVTLTVGNGTCGYVRDSSIKIVNEKGILDNTDSTLCRNTGVKFAVTNINEKNIASAVWYFSGPGPSYGRGLSTSVDYNSNGTFHPYVITTDILGCTDTIRGTHAMHIYGAQSAFRVVEPGACKNGVIDFTDTSFSDGIHPIISWQFDFGDNSSKTYSAKTAFSHMYADTGHYRVALTVVDSYGCVNKSWQGNAVNITQPFASFKLSDTLVCPGKKVMFSNTSTGQNLKYNWNFGDSTVSTDAAPTHLYTAQGTYTPALYITDINNCKDSVSLTEGVKVYRPVANFILSDSFSSCPPLTVNFSNRSANVASLQWDFGDDNTSTVLSPDHIYTYPGTYGAKLVAKGNGGCADSMIKNIVIKGPTGTLQYESKPVCYPYTQQFKAVSGNAVQYLWDYSDGQTKLTSGSTSSHQYAPGAFVPKVILIDEQGCKVPIRGADTLRIYNIMAKAYAGNQVLCDSGKITFNDSSVTNDIIVSHKWIFGNDIINGGGQVTHYFNASGMYKVALIDVTANGCTDSTTFSAPITIAKSPVVSVTGITSYCMPATIALQAQTNGQDTSITNWNWNFGNGISASVQNPSGVLLNNAGSYNVSVSATNSNGCTGTALTTVNVHALPVVKAGADTTICRAGVINLRATGAQTYRWSSSPDLSCTSCSSPLAKPDSTTTYSVTGRDEFGCSASDSVTVGVSQPVHVTVSNNDTLCNGESKQLTASGAKAYKWFPATYLSDASTAQPTFQAVKDTAITYQVVGYDEKMCFADTASIKVKVYPIPQMQVVQKAISTSAGGKVQLSTISSPDVTKWRWSPAIWLDNPNSPSPVAEPRESITYTVVAANDGACVTRAQIAVTVICSGANIFVPNTFSPNGDGVNEKFYPQGKGLYNIKSFRVFNRWGQIVFEKLNSGANNPADGWDGTYKGQLMPADVYVYMIEVLCSDNTVVPVKGNVTLLR
ncbi:MAG TPA: PKD domain-containing protein [Chitinophagaceae bacterium]|nr:PKD domain-containing protein [Chitinophagaceae bacterium]